MIVVIEPGGTIQDVRVVLRPGEKLPRKYNNERSTVYEEPLPWTLVKARGVVLPEDSPILSQPELAPVDILDLSVPVEQNSFEHIDIIVIDEKEEEV